MTEKKTMRSPHHEAQKCQTCYDGEEDDAFASLHDGSFRFLVTEIAVLVPCPLRLLESPFRNDGVVGLLQTLSPQCRLPVVSLLQITPLQTCRGLIPSCHIIRFSVGNLVIDDGRVRQVFVLVAFCKAKLVVLWTQLFRQEVNDGQQTVDLVILLIVGIRCQQGSQDATVLRLTAFFLDDAIRLVAI